MNDMKQFTTAAKEAERAKDADAGDLYPFELDGRTIVAYKPTEEQIALLMSDVGRFSSNSSKVGGSIDFFHSIFADADAAYIRQRLLNKDDAFGLPEVQDILEWLIEEWTGNPTQSQSASTPSRPSGGRKSTPRTPAST
jgi:hypothetical protein